MFRIKNLSKDFINKIIEKSAGKVPQNNLEKFLFIIENQIKQHYFTKVSESNLLRIILNQFDIAFFMNECISYPHQIEVLITISNNSNYLTDILVRNPEYFHWIINPSTLEQQIDFRYYQTQLNKNLSAYKTFDGKVNSIRNFKRKEILRVGLKDIFLKEDLKTITLLLSQLANAVSSILFELCYNEIIIKHKITNQNRKYVLFSLGKLGGDELNYSSDIDLIAFYDKNSLINKSISYNQILSEAILLFIESASKKTGSGFLYRVDFRLRPDGRNAPLCSSYADTVRYYEMRGEDWERQMLIKANFVSGNYNLYEKFYNYISHFVYPASFGVSPLMQIKKLKQNIEKYNKSDENIKLVSGGIRDIEFSIQALQLLNGGKYARLRTGNTLLAIELLSDKKILSESEAQILSTAYTFYRKAEHYLQLMNDQQKHNIPSEGEIAEKLSHFLGFTNLKSFRDSIDMHRKLVSKIYSSIIGAESVTIDTVNYDSIKFSDYKRSIKNLEFLRTGKSLLDKKQFDSRTISSFEKIEDQLLAFLSQSIDPDLVLDNFSRIIRTAQFPQIWYDEFCDERFFQMFLTLCERSQKAIDLFAEDKLLRDDFLSRDSLFQLNNQNALILPYKTFIFRSTVQMIAGILKARDFPALYTLFLKHKFSEVISDFIKEKPWENNFFIASMGSFGASELSFFSDADLIFIVDKIESFPKVQKDFQDLLKLLRENFPGLEIDCRLRPEGKSSPLVWDNAEYKKYLSNRARVWELQSFTKCSYLSGNSNLFQDIINHFFEIVKLKDKKLITFEMAEMRKKLLPVSSETFNIKKSSGSLLDIDFIITNMVLGRSDLLTNRVGNGVINFLKTLKNNKVKAVSIESLEKNYLFLKELELINQIVFNTKVSKVPSDEKKLLKLGFTLGFKTSQDFNKNLQECIKQIKTEFQKIFN